MTTSGTGAMSLFNRINNGRGPSGNANSNPGNRPVCQFFLDGRCRFGADCRNYHPPREGNSPAASHGRGSQQQLPYHLSADHVKSDLTTGDERPSWPLSAYGPGREAPRQLLEGVLEQSPEELRVQYYLAQATGGNTQEYERNETEALQQANGRVQSILADLDSALKYVIDGKDVHPNREDEVKKAAGDFPWRERPSSNAPGTAASIGGSTFGGGTSTFGQPSTFGASSSPFGGARPQTAGSAFGQPSTLGGGGQTATPFGGQQSSTFGAPSALGSSFGKPSPFGGSGGNNTGTAFGQTNTLGGGSPFGGGANMSNTQGSAFGQASSLGGNGGSTFGKPSPFGNAGGVSNATPAFGSSTPFGTSNSQPAGGMSAFGRPSQPGSVFGQPSTSNTQPSAFGASASPFAAAGGTTSGSTFGQPSQPASRPTFGSASPFGSGGTTSTSSPFGSNKNTATTAATRPNPFSTAPNLASNSNTSTAPRAPSQPLTTFKNQPVVTENRLSYYPNPAAGGRKERIWFPDGAPGPNADAEADPPQQYYDESTAVGAALRQVYDYVRQHGTFEDGLVPEMPPRREWVAFDI